MQHTDIRFAVQVFTFLSIVIFFFLSAITVVLWMKKPHMSSSGVPMPPLNSKGEALTPFVDTYVPPPLAEGVRDQGVVTAVSGRQVTIALGNVQRTVTVAADAEITISEFIIVEPPKKITVQEIPLQSTARFFMKKGSDSVAERVVVQTFPEKNE